MPRKTLAYRRGEPRKQRASMRPRPDAAENGGSAPRAGACGSARFNEAAARCRGKPARSRRTGGGRGRFNEAAARCRGKRPPAPCAGLGARLASMRPRPDAAENPFASHFSHWSATGASMRPRPDAAENSWPRYSIVPASTASMRPRPDAAENAAGLRTGETFEAASMRPRPDAAENTRLAFHPLRCDARLQ